MTDVSVLGAVAILVAAAVSDVRCYRISNRLCLSLALLFVVRSVLDGQPFPVANLLSAAAVFLGGLGLFARGLIGGGDVKLIGAAALWVPPDWVGMQMAAVTIGGAVLAILLLALRKVKVLFPPSPGGTAALPMLLQDGAPVPYGVAIAFGTILVLPLS